MGKLPRAGSGWAKYRARGLINLGATRARLWNRAFHASGFANPSGVRLHALLSWKRLGELLSRSTPRSWEARMAAARRYGKRAKPHPKLHPTVAEKLATWVKRERFRRERSARLEAEADHG